MTIEAVPASRCQRAELIAVAALVVLHLAVGAWLLPTALFPKYPDAARRLIEGTIGAEAGADYSPLYLLLNVVLGPQALRWGQGLLGGLAIFAVYGLGRRFAGPIGGLSAALLLASCRALLLYEATLEPDLLIAAFNAGGLLCLALVSPTGRRRVTWTLIAATFLGLAAAARPAGLCFLPLAALWLLFLPGPGPARPWRLSALLLVSSLALALAPPLLVQRALPAAATSTMSPGQVFHIGSRPESNGLGMQPPFLLMRHERQLKRYAIHELARTFARAAEGEELTAAQTQAYWARMAVAYFRRHPLDFAALQARKVVFLIVGHDAHDVFDVRVAQKRLGTLPLLGTGALGMLAIVGLALGLLRRRRESALLALHLGSAVVLVMAAYVTTRYRLAVLPTFCLLGGVAIAQLAGGLRDRRLLLTGALGLLAAVGLQRLAGVDEADRLVERGLESSSLLLELQKELHRGDFAAAAERFAVMQAAQPFNVRSLNLRGIPFEAERLVKRSGQLSAQTWGVDGLTDEFLLAVLSARAGHCDQALPSFDGLAERGYRASIYDHSLDPALEAASCLLRRGDRPAAASRIARSLQNRPGNLDGLAAAVAAATAAPEQAKVLPSGLEEELFALHDPLSAHFALARERVAWGDAEGALRDTARVLAKLPDSGLVWHLRAQALALLGRHDEALESYGKALRLFPDNPFPTRPLDASIAQLSPVRLADPALAWLVVEHHLRAGRLSIARATFEKAREFSGPSTSAELEEQRGLLERATSAESWLSP